MKIKNTKFYTIYSMIILIFIVISGYALSKLSTFARETYQPLPLYRTSFTVLFLFGGILGLESLLNEKNKDGKWSLNPLKLIILGGPSLLVIVWRWFPIVFEIVPINARFPSVINHSIIYNLSTVLFG